MKKIIAILLTLTLVFSLAVPAMAEVGTPKTDKKVFNYVSFGASNTCGYGLAGFMPEEMYKDPSVIWKDSATALRDGCYTSGYYYYDNRCYPVLVKDALQKQFGDEYEVVLSQCAVNAMRVDELRFVLDENYGADSYQMWRYGDGTPGTGWVYDLERERDDTIDLNGAEFKFAKGKTSMHDEFTAAIKKADLISFDLGVNNFGGFISERMFDKGLVDVDYKALIGEKYDKAFDTVREYVRKTIVKLTNGAVTEDILKELGYYIDTIAYAYLSFVVNFDADMKLITELNPTTDIVVVSIQNLMRGLKAEIAGITIPFGDVFGAMIKMANSYMAVRSPYHTRYSYADVTSGAEHVEFFIDEIVNYNGDPYSLSKDMTCCFDVFDQYTNVPVQLKDYYWNPESNPGRAALDAGVPEVVATFDLQRYAAYHAMATMFKEGVSCDTLYMDELGTTIANISPYWNQAWMEFFNTPAMAIFDGADFNDVLNTATENVTALAHSSKSYETFVSLFTRVLFANCFFSHPTAKGHVQLKDAVLKAYNRHISGNYAVATAPIKNIAYKIMNKLGLLKFFDKVVAFFNNIIQK